MPSLVRWASEWAGAVGEDADQPVKRQRQADGVDARELDIAGLDGPAADAVVPVLGAMGRGGAVGGTSAGVLSVRDVTRLGRPAEEGAGQEKAGQEQCRETFAP